MRNTVISKLSELAANDESIFLITGDLGYGVLDTFQEQHPTQFLNAGVTEQSMLSLAGGLASNGKTVFVYSIANFPTIRALEQIRNDICAMNNSVIVISVGAGYAYGPQGYTHHALEDIAAMRIMPNMSVCIPCDALEATQIVELLVKKKKPSYLRIGKNGEKQLLPVTTNTQWGYVNEITSGSDGTFLFCGNIGTIAIEAAKILQANGQNIAVASNPFINELDKEYLLSAAKKGPIVVIEEHVKSGGLGSAILEFFSENNMSAKVGIIGATRENLGLIGTQDYLREKNGLNVNEIILKFRKLLEL